MLKRLAILLLGIGLIGLGVLLFVAPGGHVSLQWLAKLWPVFLVLAGLVQVAGHLIDRHPRSPVGGMMIAAVGGVLLAANLRGDHSLLLLFGQYWFWLLLAFIIGRVLKQYTHHTYQAHQAATGARPRAFSAGAIVVMILLVGGGLASNFLAKNKAYLNGVESKLGRLGLFGSEFEVNAGEQVTLTLSPASHLVISGFKGDIEVSATAESQPTAQLIARIRANNKDEASQIASNIHLQVTPAGKNLQFSINTDGVQNDYSAKLIIVLPTTPMGGVEIVKATGSIKLNGLRGDQVIRGTDRVEVRNNTGRVTIENPRSAELGQIHGEVSVTGARGNLELRAVKGAITLEARGGNVNVEQSSGPVQARVRDAHLTINDLASDSPGPAAQPILKLTDASNTRINLQEIKGAVSINAERSRIEAENINGDLTINNSSERVQLNHINGALKVNTENSTVEIEEFNGAAVIEATRDVTVRGFRGPLSVTTTSGAIDLSTDEKLAGNLKATSERGRIRVSIPEDSDFKLDAGSEGGRVRVRGFEDLNAPSRQRQLTMEHGTSLNSFIVLLRSSRGDVQLQSSGLALTRGNNHNDGDNDPPEEPKPATKPLKPLTKPMAGKPVTKYTER
ncbi:MAG: DUF4097 family beta strand repeat-containing protein [Blastocatellia bacterium]